MKTKEYTVSLTEAQARALENHCATIPAPPEGIMAAWVADKLDLIQESRNDH